MTARLGRTIVLCAGTLALLSGAAFLFAVVAVVTGFRARRLYSEVMARWLSRAILALWRIEVEVLQDAPFPATQTIYVSNHSSTLDMFALVALGLPRTRFVGAADVDGFLRWMAPLGVISRVMETWWAPPPSQPAARARWFRRLERRLRHTGDSVYLSPEGERVTTGRIGPFNADNFGLALSLGAPIVPLYIEIPPAIDPGKGCAALPGTVRVRVLSAIPTRGWRLETLESHAAMVRDIFVRLHAERHLSRRAPGHARST